MSLDPLTAALDIGGKLIERIWPNPEDQAAARRRCTAGLRRRNRCRPVLRSRSSLAPHPLADSRGAERHSLAPRPHLVGLGAVVRSTYGA